MTRYLLDTNILSDLMRDPRGRVADRIRQVGEARVCTSIIVVAELRYEVAKKGSARLAARLDAVIGLLRVLPFEPPADAVYGRLRANLEAVGTRIGGNDLFIAAQAVALGCTVVTANVTEFRQIEGLRVENWLERV